MVIPGERPGDGSREVPVPRMLQEQPAMSHEQAREIAALVRDLSGRFGYPADFEGAIAAGIIYLFQARPITTLG
jgi:pyruvate,water dikinase